MTDLLCDRCGKFLADGVIGPEGNFHYQCSGADGSGIDWTERPMPNTYAAPVFEPMTPYAEQAEQARAEEDSLAWHIAECLSGDVDCAVEQAKRVEILKRIPLLDTLARVEAVVNKDRIHGADLGHVKGYSDCCDAVLKALEGE